MYYQMFVPEFKLMLIVRYAILAGQKPYEQVALWYRFENFRYNKYIVCYSVFDAMPFLA